MMKVLVTGANGFIGRALCAQLQKAGFSVIPAVRRSSGIENEYVLGQDNEEWLRALSGCDVVVHLSGCTHMMYGDTAEQLHTFRVANVDESVRIALLAAQANVRRFIFMSSIKVNGERSQLDCPLKPNDSPAPQDAYGLSKWEAEQALHSIAQLCDFELVVIRPPLVYGPGVKGNFLKLIKYVKLGIPLPLGAVRNKRSMIALHNLVEFTSLCANFVESPLAAGQVFFVSDGEDVSTTVLLYRIANAFACKSRLVHVPTWILRLIALLVGRSADAERLLGTLTIDISKANKLLGWQPNVTMEEQLKNMVDSKI